MKTLTIASARKTLPSVLNRVKKGEDIGIIAGDIIVQLKPVEVVAWEDSYLWQEYNVTPREWKRFNTRMKSRRAKAEYHTFKGSSILRRSLEGYPDLSERVKGNSRDARGKSKGHRQTNYGSAALFRSASLAPRAMVRDPGWAKAPASI
jgi:antitoxin (DNA-binding transcriptional repressor) of toxin-antitoxin stability system